MLEEERTHLVARALALRPHQLSAVGPQPHLLVVPPYNWVPTVIHPKTMCMRTTGATGRRSHQSAKQLTLMYEQHTHTCIQVELPELRCSDGSEPHSFTLTLATVACCHEDWRPHLPKIYLSISISIGWLRSVFSNNKVFVLSFVHKIPLVEKHGLLLS